MRGISFDVGTRETLGAVGESGCGKTAAMLAVMGLLPVPPVRVEATHIRFAGRELTQLSPSAMRQIRGNRLAMVFQEPMTALNPYMTIGSQITEVIHAHESVSNSEAKARALKSLREVGIPDPGRCIEQYPHELSGGMRQRVTIAMALILRPELLIADEPTTALDATVEAQIVHLITELRSRLGMSVIWITHNLGIVAELCDRTMVMYAGIIVEAAPTRELFSNPCHPYTEALIRSLPAFHKPGEKLKGIEGAPPDLRQSIYGCPFAPRCHKAIAACLREPVALKEVFPGHFSACLRSQTPDVV